MKTTNFQFLSDGDGFLVNEDFTTVGSWCDQPDDTFRVGDTNGSVTMAMEVSVQSTIHTYLVMSFVLASIKTIPFLKLFLKSR